MTRKVFINRNDVEKLRGKAARSRCPTSMIIGQRPNRRIIHFWPNGTSSIHKYGATCLCDINYLLKTHLKKKELRQNNPMNDTPKYKKVINRNGWMARLYRFSTDREPNFRGFCPFFWSTLFFMLIFPITVLCRLCETVIKFAAAAFKRDIDTAAPRRNICFIKQISQSYSSSTIKAMIAGEHFYHGEEEALKSIPNWKEKLEKILENRQIQEEAAEKARKARQARQETYDQLKNNLAKFGRFFIWPGVIASSVGAAYLVYKFAAYFWSVTKLEDVLSAAKIIVGFVVIYFAALSIAKIFQKLSRYKERVEAALPVAIEEPEDYSPSLWSRFWEGVGEFIDGIKSLYRRECPLIEWSDDKTGPIEKRKQED